MLPINDNTGLFPDQTGPDGNRKKKPKFNLEVIWQFHGI
jgi:hypothetical protein